MNSKLVNPITCRYASTPREILYIRLSTEVESDKESVGEKDYEFWQSPLKEVILFPTIYDDDKSIRVHADFMLITKHGYNIPVMASTYDYTYLEIVDKTNDFKLRNFNLIWFTESKIDILSDDIYPMDEIDKFLYKLYNRLYVFGDVIYPVDGPVTEFATYSEKNKFSQFYSFELLDHV